MKKAIFFAATVLFVLTLAGTFQPTAYAQIDCVSDAQAWCNGRWGGYGWEQECIDACTAELTCWCLSSRPESDCNFHAPANC